MRVKGGHVSTLLSSEGRRRRLKKRRERKREREEDGARDKSRETREETYHAKTEESYEYVVSRSVRSEFDETLHFGSTTT